MMFNDGELMMGFIKAAGAVLALAATGSIAYADSRILTASIDDKGQVTAQSPTWVKEVKLTAQPDYFSEYKVRFVPGVFKKMPRFCTVSVTDVSSNEHIFYGHAKLGSVPAINYVNVLTLKVGDDKPAGDSSMGFMLMCVE
ncbi:hypothetical protein SAMN04490179_1179 [Pseudomonas antarctica]|uniref:Uncharacterized protein n=1 Tax=Pseudomonas antarctica TaxID=219572 RepID=A0A1G9WID7_9PSED|nr:hypothetical protein PSAN_18200 [Pseudomonas antarctica]SDM83805.1 hypothetical protein SAMN04490179_1179 [Pseudomonas antarctica]